MSLAFAPQGARAKMPPTSATIQKLLDENSQLIKTIVEYQSTGSANECMQYQQILHRNLVYLATIADSNNQNMGALLPAPVQSQNGPGQARPCMPPQNMMAPGKGGMHPGYNMPPSQPPSSQPPPPAQQQGPPTPGGQQMNHQNYNMQNNQQMAQPGKGSPMGNSSGSSYSPPNSSPQQGIMPPPNNIPNGGPYPRPNGQMAGPMMPTSQAGSMPQNPYHSQMQGQQMGGMQNHMMARNTMPPPNSTPFRRGPQQGPYNQQQYPQQYPQGPPGYPQPYNQQYNYPNYRAPMNQMARMSGPMGAPHRGSPGPQGQMSPMMNQMPNQRGSPNPPGAQMGQMMPRETPSPGQQGQVMANQSGSPGPNRQGSPMMAPPRGPPTPPSSQDSTSSAMTPQKSMNGPHTTTAPSNGESVNQAMPPNMVSSQANSVPSPGPPHLPSPGQGPPHLTSQSQGPPHLTSTGQGPPHLNSQSQGPPHLTSPGQGPPHLTSQSQGPPHLTSPGQGPPHLTSQSQGPPHLTSQGQGPSHLASQGQGPPHMTSQSQEAMPSKPVIPVSQSHIPSQQMPYQMAQGMAPHSMGSPQPNMGHHHNMVHPGMYGMPQGMPPQMASHGMPGQMPAQNYPGYNHVRY